MGVRRTAYDREMADWLGNVAPLALLCQQCGGCAAVCPSQRHGGIRPAELMERAVSGSLDPIRESSLWLCARCMSCSERCPSGADPGEVIAHLRERAVVGGEVPAFLREEAQRFLTTGLSFPRTGMTRKMRKELGLPDGEVSAEAVAEAHEICQRTGLGRAVHD
ncbi:MAG: CoB--CoM heterodisulfide reductase iron-sulfur subunit C [Methanomassiliicoccales archaeon PtaU1.Bin030]|nr:MAG: CoB--CoM heterodisulfide reductase iron-sulfur subunit C [Methanomassiliicoccales archaeon PtaU1.Bin030]